MFGWLRQNPQPPVSAEERDWLERRFEWLTQQFGECALTGATVVEPTTKFFPAAYSGTHAELQDILQIVCKSMQVDRARVRLRFFEDSGGQFVRGREAAHGLYAKTTRKEEIWLEASVLSDPMTVVATLAHELAHAKLIGEKRLNPDSNPDHEKVTDLTTVFFGLGIFAANCVLREFYWDAGQTSGWQMERGGYLTMDEFGYALALFSFARNETDASWHRFLRKDVRAALNRGVRYLSRIDRESDQRRLVSTDDQQNESGK